MNLLLVLLTAGVASAAPPRLDVKIYEGFRLYSRSLPAVEGTYASTSGSPRGADDHDLSFDYTLTPDGDAFVLDFWINLTAKGGGRGLGQSGSVALRRGQRLRVLDCGHWKVEVGLDALAGAGRGKPPAPPANYWLTETTSGAFGPRRCRQSVGLAKRGAVGDFVSSPSSPGRQTLFSADVSFPLFQSGAAEPADAGAFDMMYSVEAGSGRLSSSTPLTLGRPKSVSSGGARVVFLLTRDGSAKARPRGEDSGERSRVRLLR